MEVWKVEQIRKGSSTNMWDDNRFLITSLFKPSARDMVQAQIQMGYDPKGYGKPFLVSQKQDNGTWKTIISCQGSCD
jgi:hypothetical protein